MTEPATLERTDMDMGAAPIVACTASREIRRFDLLIEDMESLLGHTWGDLSFEDATLFLDQPEALELEFLVVAMGDDEDDLVPVAHLVEAAAARDIDVLLVAEGVDPAILHDILGRGAREFLPYPLPEGALDAAVERLRMPAVGAPAVVQMVPPPPAEPQPPTPNVQRKPGREGVIMPVQALAGGVGATTFAANLAVELSRLKKDAPKVCLIDLDLQRGAVANYLDLTPNESVLELLSDTEAMDDDSFAQALQPAGENLNVLTAPPDLVPLDFLAVEDVERLLIRASDTHDFVIVDMPAAIVQWTETVLARAPLYFALLELDMRSAQNAMRLLNALKAEELPHDKLRFVLNRTPGTFDLAGRSRMKRLAETLSISFELQLPDGGRDVREASDRGQALADAAKRNPLRKEIAKLAQKARAHERAAATATG